MAAHQEFVDFVKTRGVNQAYLDEILKYGFVPDPKYIVYHAANNLDQPATGMSPTIVNDVANFRQRQLDISDIYLYNRVNILLDSNIFPNADYRDLQKAGIRILVYHEMTHTLQKAYEVLHVDDKYKTDKSAYLRTNFTLKDLNPIALNWTWPPIKTFEASNNRVISQESQSEGIMHDFFVKHYHLSSAQQQQFWLFYFDSLKDMRLDLEEIKTIIDSNYPNLNKTDFGHALSLKVFGNVSGEDGSIIREALRSTENLPLHIGYLNPITGDNLDVFWQTLQTI